MSSFGSIRKRMHGAKAEKAKAEAAVALRDHLKNLGNTRNGIRAVALIHLAILAWFLMLTWGYLDLYQWSRAQRGAAPCFSPSSP